MAWTRERLEEVARARLGGARLVVVANREPYLHVYDGDAIRCTRPASGLATARGEGASGRPTPPGGERRWRCRP